MNDCNEERKSIQDRIIREAISRAAEESEAPVIFLGGDWHQGVVGIAASRLCEEFWKPVWLFEKKPGQAICKGSARSIGGFDVTDAMSQVSSELFTKFGGHAAAGGFSFPVENEGLIRSQLIRVAGEHRRRHPEAWESTIRYDFRLPDHLVDLQLMDRLHELRPFGHGFAEPLFRVRGAIEEVRFLRDKKTGEDRHTSVRIRLNDGQSYKVMFFNEVAAGLTGKGQAEFLVNVSKNTFRGRTSLDMIGRDWHG